MPLAPIDAARRMRALLRDLSVAERDSLLAAAALDGRVVDARPHLRPNRIRNRASGRRQDGGRVA